MQLRRFNGKNSAVRWWCQFKAYISLHRMPVRDDIQSLNFYLEGAGETWFHILDPIIKMSLETLRAAFMARFCPLSVIKTKPENEKALERMVIFLHNINKYFQYMLYWCILIFIENNIKNFSTCIFTMWIPRGDVGVEYVLSTPLRVVRGD